MFAHLNHSREIHVCLQSTGLCCVSTVNWPLLYVYSPLTCVVCLQSTDLCCMSTVHWPVLCVYSLLTCVVCLHSTGMYYVSTVHRSMTYVYCPLIGVFLPVNCTSIRSSILEQSFWIRDHDTIFRTWRKASLI